VIYLMIFDTNCVNSSSRWSPWMHNQTVKLSWGIYRLCGSWFEGVLSPRLLVPTHTRKIITTGCDFFVSQVFKILLRFSHFWQNLLHIVSSSFWWTFSPNLKMVMLIVWVFKVINTVENICHTCTWSHSYGQIELTITYVGSPCKH
jgi:hypothetical protein